MKLKTKLKYTLAVIGISLSVSAHADAALFGESNFNSTNGLNITTTSGDYFVPITDSGWWDLSNNIIHNASIKNYFADTHIDSSQEPSNNFFTFDLSGISGTTISASLRLFTYGMAGTSVEYRLFDITSPLFEVRATGTSASVHNDLMSGVSYGSFIYESSDANRARYIILNADGVSALNHAMGGEFGIGGTITGGIPGEYISAIPEPSTYSLLLAGLGLIGIMVRNRKQEKLH